jgi:phytanoyl-CoA hydroxylase
MVNKAYFGIKEYENFNGEKIDLGMKKGDIVFFHPLLIHGSGENKSQGYRKVPICLMKSMCCHFAASNCKYEPVEGKVQELVAKEIMSYANKKFPGVTDYQSLWRMKSQLVAGK